jgi:hypothetical protein
MARTDEKEGHIYGEVNSLEDLREINRTIREQMDSAGERERLTELKKRSDYLCTLAEAGSWEEKFGDKIGRIREVAKEENQTTVNHANAVARKHGWDADYDAWGSGERGEKSERKAA